MDNIITTERIEAYCLSLLADERSAGTISKYHRDLTAFSLWLDGRAVTKETAAGWKSHLSHRGYAPCTVNSMLAAVNGFCHFMAWHIKVKFLKIQRQIFRDSAKELTKEEYDRLLTAARESGQERLVLIMETLCATGIRVSELGDYSMEYDLKTPEQQAEVCNVVRFAIDRSRLTREHLDYVIAAVKELYEDRENIPNMRIVWGHNLPMRHFHAFLEPYPNEG